MREGSSRSCASLQFSVRYGALHNNVHQVQEVVAILRYFRDLVVFLWKRYPRIFPIRSIGSFSLPYLISLMVVSKHASIANCPLLCFLFSFSLLDHWMVSDWTMDVSSNKEFVSVVMTFLLLSCDLVKVKFIWYWEWVEITFSMVSIS